jgi:DNA gyrase subunit B
MNDARDQANERMGVQLFNVIKVLRDECRTIVETTMDPNLELRQVTIDSLAEADRVFSMLMGDEVPPSREFIEKMQCMQILMLKN